MREKILMFLRLNGFDKVVEEFAESPAQQLIAGFKDGFGEELPADAAEAAKLMESTLKGRSEALRTAWVEIYEKYLTEEEMDALIAWHSSPVQQKIQQIGRTIQEALDSAREKWEREAFAVLEPDFKRLLGYVEPEIASPSTAEQSTKRAEEIEPNTRIPATP